MLELMDFFTDRTNVLIASFVISWVAFTILWLINLRTKDAGVVDFYWGPGFSVIAWFNYLTLDKPEWYHLVFAIAVTIWSFKLAGQLIVRNLKDDHEDVRYAKMRKEGGDTFWWQSFFTIYTLQAIIMWIVATPIHLGLLFPLEEIVSSPVFFFGLLISLFGFSFESVADHQLFKGRMETSPDKTFSNGLWRISRHPNYLGEMVGWIGFGLIGFTLSGSYLVFAGPVVLIAVMYFISLPLTEISMAESRKDWEQYKAETPKLVPDLSALFKRQRHIDPAE